MPSRATTADQRSLGIVSVSFVAGLAWAALTSAPALWDPVPEPYFGLDEVVVESEVLPSIAAELPPADGAASPAEAAVRNPSMSRRSAGDLAHMAAVLATLPPERLALGGAPAPILDRVAAQALPTGAADRDRPAAIPGETAGNPGPPPLLSPPPIVSPPNAAPPESLKALVDRLQPQADAAPRTEPRLAQAAETPAGAAPLPGTEWIDPEAANWSEAATGDGRSRLAPRGSRLLGRIVERRTEPGTARNAAGGVGERLRERLRAESRGDRSPDNGHPGDTGTPVREAAGADARRWPEATRLCSQLEELGHAGQRGAAEAAVWARDTLAALAAARATGGPRDPVAEPALITLGDQVAAGMTAADADTDPLRGSQIRRAALAAARRVAVWRAAAACCAEIDAPPRREDAVEVAPALAMRSAMADIASLLEALERYESDRSTHAATEARRRLVAVAATPLVSGSALARAVADHYLAPNVRIAVHAGFVERMLPESTVTTGPLHDFVLGRRVRGTKTVEQSTGVRFTPHTSQIRLELVVSGEVASRTVTESGPVAFHTRGQSTFFVMKPIALSAAGLAFGAARGTASNQSQLANVETSFDGVPIMGSLVRSIARNQHDENKAEATREVNDRIVSRACREVDAQTEPKLSEMADRIRDRLWTPLEGLELEPTAVALETATDVATARLRLAAADHLAAHTPRPRAPADAAFSLQVHESTLNNTFDRLDLAGRRLELEELAGHVCQRLGAPPRIPADLPEGVTVTFAAEEPLRVECRDGLVHVRVTLDALESGGRRNWYDIVACVAYRPVATGLQVALVREGPVQLCGAGQQGRMEIALRTIFGKIFAKERDVRLLPDQIVTNRRLADLQAVQAVSADGWLALALGRSTQAGEVRTSPTARAVTPPGQRLRR